MIYKSILLILGYLYGSMLTATFVVKHSTGNDVSRIGSGIRHRQGIYTIMHGEEPLHLKITENK